MTGFNNRWDHEGEMADESARHVTAHTAEVFKIKS